MVSICVIMVIDYLCVCAGSKSTVSSDDDKSTDTSSDGTDTTGHPTATKHQVIKQKLPSYVEYC